MEYALFIGCNIPARLPQFESSFRAVAAKLGLKLVDFPDFSCCGYPMRNASREAFVLSAAGNLAAAEMRGLNIMALCKCCFGALCHARHIMEKDHKLKGWVNDKLGEHDLVYTGKVDVLHFLTVLHHFVGEKEIKKAVTRPFRDLRVAVHNGCHALRPSRITRFDDPVNPTMFDSLVKLTGARPVEWDKKLECCGAPHTGSNDRLAGLFTKKKVASAQKAGAEFLVTGCPWCQVQFDVIQQQALSEKGGGPPLPSVSFPQLLALAMDLPEKTVGLESHVLDPTRLLGRLAPRRQEKAGHEQEGKKQAKADKSGEKDS